MKADDDRFDALLDEHARSYNEPASGAPSDAQRDVMWERIAAARRVRPIEDVRRGRAWLQSIAAAAALLILGIAIGRYTVDRNDAATPALDVAETQTRPGKSAGAAPTGSDAVPTPYRMAAVEHFGRAELLLTRFGSSGDTDEEVFDWARSLLGDTRLLLNSPAGVEPEYRELLADLELVLAQIVYAAGRRSEDERRWVAEGLEQRGVMQRLRMMKPANAGI